MNDERGRILLPLEMRRKFKTRRFKITAKKNRMELEPLPRVEELKGKYKNVIKFEWEDLEEMGEKFVSSKRR
jgi:bifunctional DNA-binding transcriptional regulator/antitoxin component of YhaV-PrlF toxin-antitoxin module